MKSLLKIKTGEKEGRVGEGGNQSVSVAMAARSRARLTCSTVGSGCHTLRTRVERYEMKRLDGRLSSGDLLFELQIRALLVQSWTCKKKKKKKNPQ